MKRRLKLAIAATVAAVALLFTGSVPAQAVTLSRVAYCNWPYKASIQAGNHSGSIRMVAYSPGGTYLGTYYGSGFTVWHTRWEDVIVWGYTSDPSWHLSHTCRL